MDDKLAEILKLTKENNKILRGMRSTQRWSSFFSFIYYIVLIGSFVGAYYYLQPILDSIIGSYQNVLSEINNAQNNLSEAGNINIDPNQIKELLNL